MKRLSKRLTNLIVLAIAIPYFLLDAIFATVAIPLARWIAGHWAFARIHRWILSLRPYPTLLLFIAPLIVLEPAKPVAAYLVSSGHAKLGLSVLASAEILKLVFIERLFSVSRDKLLSIPAFAWAYGKYSAVKNWLMSFAAWQLVLRWSRIARQAAQRLARQARRSIPRGDVGDARDRSHRRDSRLPVRALAARQTREAKDLKQRQLHR
ncbi:MAG: hypothetical protein KGL35_25080 [Bradyrhizobium sp.]|uniref:hypothetical protein n=1 Tax=Bradyrhizobium sp. TaxID=376 RepID=UPI001C293BB8|nr:hypothetical protein [Bradyrhizobium sp.]MBU6462604.1 hypothetical protein [Pseudomonadota bacterium]MDE2067225.1 hypothetical protein [Bradyrhizobium sp.]MDE2471909.1 hypothetical protein [Bradyrhizobium sp.]